jgi:hypothetical protein
MDAGGLPVTERLTEFGEELRMLEERLAQLHQAAQRTEEGELLGAALLELEMCREQLQEADHELRAQQERLREMTVQAAGARDAEADSLTMLRAIGDLGWLTVEGRELREVLTCLCQVALRGIPEVLAVTIETEALAEPVVVSEPVTDATEPALRLELPLSETGTVRGTMTLTATGDPSLHDSLCERATVFASAVGSAIHQHAQLGALREYANQIEQALRTRPTIEQAKGILMAVHGWNDDEAFAQLVRQSQKTNVKLRSVAEQLVQQSRHAARREN